MTTELSVIVPCYNEEKNIPLILERFAAAVGKRSDMEVILVDNGSQDATGRVMGREMARPEYAFARKAVVEKNQGYGYGILSGLREAKGSVLAWTHADLQTDPGDVVKAFERYLEISRENAGRLMIKGHRRNRGMAEKLFSLGMQCLSSAALGMWFTEVNAQPKLFPRGLYERFDNPPHDFSLDLYLLWLAKANGYKIVSIPVYFNKRLYGEAKGGGGSSPAVKWKLIKRTASYIFRLKAEISARKMRQPKSC